MPTDPQARTEIRHLLESAGHEPDSRYGQNFLADPNIVDRMTALADVKGRDVVEIGAGTGALTFALCNEAARVVSYEIDPVLASIVTDAEPTPANLEVRNEDAARVDLEAALGGSGWVLVGNLPYNVGTGIVLDALRHAPNVDRFVVMVQQEVADRMLARPGSRTYGLPSVVVGLHAVGRLAFRVPPQVFEPPPRVESAVVVLDRQPTPPLAERAISFAAAGFGQRRKMLRRSLRTLVADPTSLLTSAGIDPTMRAEDLGPSDFVAIATAEAA